MLVVIADAQKRLLSAFHMRNKCPWFAWVESESSFLPLQTADFPFALSALRIHVGLKTIYFNLNFQANMDPFLQVLKVLRKKWKKIQNMCGKLGLEVQSSPPKWQLTTRSAQSLFWTSVFKDFLSVMAQLSVCLLGGSIPSASRFFKEDPNCASAWWASPLFCHPGKVLK